jgi:hypothetical protein
MAGATIGQRLSHVICATVLSSMAASGCAPLGARALVTDQSSYVVALSEAQKKQLFTNLVRIRYGEPASFVTLGQIVQGYTLRGGVNVGADLGLLPNEGPNISGNVIFEDRPTLTFTPVQGREFLDAFLVPVPPKNVIAAIEIGWPPDLVLRLAVQSINGISNALISGNRLSDADPRFVWIAELMHKLIVDNVIELSSVTPGKKSLPATALLIRNPDRRSPADQAMLADFLRLLGLSPNAKRISIKFGRTRPLGGNTLNIQTRSYIQILYAVAATIDVPKDDVTAGLTRRTVTDDPESGRPTLAIRSGASDPGATHTKIRYKGRWFWIENDDFESKRAFAFLLLLLTLTDRGDSQQAPLLTVRG